MKVILIEDDKGISGFIQKGLKQKGHWIECYESGEEGIQALEHSDFDVLVLDLMLPGMNGFKVMDYLKARDIMLPILILSARKTVEDRVKGIRNGGDDYLVKPFALAELEVRLEALCRRNSKSDKTISQDLLTFEDLELNLLSRKVTRNNDEIDLMPREYDLLNLLMGSPEQVITRSLILDRIWDFQFDPQTNVVDVLVSRLRSKIDKGYTEKYIQTIRGIGYTLRKHGN